MSTFDWDRAAEEHRARMNGDAEAPEDEAQVEASITDIKTEVSRLARLEPLAYEAERIPAAKRLGIRATVLDQAVAKARPKDEPEVEAVRDVGPVARTRRWCVPRRRTARATVQHLREQPPRVHQVRSDDPDR